MIGNMPKRKFVLIFSLAIVLIAGSTYGLFLKKNDHVKLYWFIPDGMRAEETLFTVYKWAQEGQLPNIKKMMDNGAYGYSIADFPSHTPVNFASLLTGTHPNVHGVTDGPMRIEGKPLDKPAVGGFTSIAKKVSPIWTVLENVGKKVVLLSIPGSTPPELKKGITIRGRWGNWGSDDAALIFEPKERQAALKSVGAGFRLFFMGDTLTKFVNETETINATVQSFSPVKTATLSAHGLEVFVYLLDSTNNKKTDYDRLAFGLDDQGGVISTMPQGDWSDWIKVNLTFKDETYESNIKLKPVKIWADGKFRIRVLYNNLNKFVTMPESVANDMNDDLGPMVDFVDNFPPQLIYEPEDKDTFLEEARMSWEYHAKAADFVMDKYKPDVFLQDIYTPNQMLSSRWWMRYVDPKSPQYTQEGSKKPMEELLEMYKGLDAIIGEALKHDDGKTLFVLSSDHGIILQKRVVSLNNLFAQKGWLQYTIDPITGVMVVDWAKTKVIHLQTNNIYIHPHGLAGPYIRSKGAEYEKLREEVRSTLLSLRDGENKAIHDVTIWEDAPKFLEVSSDRIGDLVVALEPGYGFSEAATLDKKVFVDSLVSGNKQSYDPNTDGLQTPFVIMGPGVKKGYKLRDDISHIDQMPTILKLMGVKIPSYVQGSIVNEILK